MGKFTELCRAFSTKAPLRRDFINPGVPEPHWTLRNIADTIRALPDVTRPGCRFPDRYKDVFVARLRRRAAHAEHALWLHYTKHRVNGFGEFYASATTNDWLDVITGSVTSWDSEEDLDVLQALAGMTSDIYRDFFREARHADPDVLPVTNLPPLVDLSYQTRWGPHTINGHEMLAIGGSAIGIVSMPRSYADHPLMWVTVAHEVAGHNAINGMSARSGSAWAALDIEGHLAQSITPALDLVPGWEAIWQRWVEEAASDVFGFLAMGPYFCVGMAAWLSAAKACYPFGPQTAAGRLENVVYLRNGVIIGEHPPDILRTHLALGAIDGMLALGHTHAQPWIALLEDIAQEAGTEQATIAVHETTVGGTYLHLPLAPLLRDARRIGRHLATIPIVPQDGSDGKGIAELVHWSVQDQALAEAVRPLAIQGAAAAAQAPRAARASHFLAGAMMAAFEDPTRYDALNAFLLAALKARFPASPFA